MTFTRGSMNRQTLSSLIDKAITDALARRTLWIESLGFESTQADIPRQPTTFVLITGDDAAAFPATLRYLAALAQAGCLLSVHFSHSAQRLHTRFADALNRLLPQVPCQQATDSTLRSGDTLLLPALSDNSLAKIALGLRDNAASQWVFQALAQDVRIIALHHPDAAMPAAYLAQLSRYQETLRQFGIRMMGQPAAPQASVPHRAVAAVGKSLLTARDVRLHSEDTLSVRPGTLITPAARDELAARRITLITAS
ncbi:MULTISPECIES: flavoprotein [unclassified Symbiopectobacterium]|uniref:flavoprotein n=1 Tax=unclassified Symbiopectobacterium TaxID=2794573 RepID=UPI002227A252|nr:MULTISPECIES: flavoprotein [unclassified Symbiopectobacterium]MCW2475195.1 hypothetical protein [Candidatus Symbiopectobacterium sp. NZEC151]MCW2483288.1 hypothetical protein [Candidatus Symbiopectobacterium sp. NZEC135]